MRRPGYMEPCPRCENNSIWIKAKGFSNFADGVLLQWCDNCGMVGTLENPFTVEVDI